MAYYRLYYMHGATEHVDSFDEFEADEDSIAIERAERRLGVNPMELWSNHRKVKRWDGAAARELNSTPR